ncbi:transcriptional gntr-family [Novosphingobium sp. Rr 2-17]|uniref:GntR family transcriptional regulator n=1 Tax=Novosphingobium sp. Rr 2-17 TaxID=555793 RepID=UPI0002697EBA|nr:GntR family transcriptional regulator [Novosphingobium sp. Rr 2-17]EIZ79490.1 transcriptional gntr-family [Novosphingobium sp. Rr 2-17]
MTAQFAVLVSDRGIKRERRAALLARQIEHDVCQRRWPVGTIFASQQELIQRYCVGTDCLRDAIRILEFNGVGRMRPGPGGGLLVSRPSINLPVASVVGHFQVIWESGDGVARREIQGARLTVAALAARICCQDKKAKDDGGDQWRWAMPKELRASSRFVVAMADVTADPFLQLASRSLLTLGHLFGESADQLSGKATRDNQELFSNLSEAIIAADADGAAFHAKCLVDQLEHSDPSRETKMSDPFLSEGSPLNRSRVGQLVRLIATEINTGAFGKEKILGAEAVLAERYVAALSTVRQALAVLEDAGVVAVRRGRSNGWFACEPSLELPLRQVRNYLASSQMDPVQAQRLIELIRKEPAQASKNAIFKILLLALESYATLSVTELSFARH